MPYYLVDGYEEEYNDGYDTGYVEALSRVFSAMKEHPDVIRVILEKLKLKQDHIDALKEDLGTNFFDGIPDGLINPPEPVIYEVVLITRKPSRKKSRRPGYKMILKKKSVPRASRPAGPGRQRATSSLCALKESCLSKFFILAANPKKDRRSLESYWIFSGNTPRSGPN